MLKQLLAGAAALSKRLAQRTDRLALLGNEK
jgi:hypothetical protein